MAKGKHNKREKQKTCFLYVRVSTKMQVENGESLDAQLYELKKYAEYRGFQIVGEYVDAGFSGRSIEGRPDFRRMLDDIKGGQGPDYVLVFKLSRFARNAADALNALQLMKDYGTHLICVKDGVDSERSTGRLIITILSAVAEMEKENIREQTLAGRYQKAREGRWNGGPTPYGYRIGNDSILVQEPAEAEVVAMIFNWYTGSKMGYQSISSELNIRGYTRAKRGNIKNTTFNPKFVRDVLGNPVYTGKIAYGRRRAEMIEGQHSKTHVVKQDEYEIFDGKHEPIVSQEVWDAAQEKLRRNGKRFSHKGKNNRVTLLSGMLKCPVCGRGMVANKSQGKIRRTTGKRGKDTYGYECKYTRKSQGSTCTFTRQYNQEIIDKEVIEVIKAAAHSKVFEERIKAELSAATDEEQIRSELDASKKSRLNNEAARKKLMERMDTLDAAAPSYDREYDECQTRLSVLYDKAVEIDQVIARLEGDLAAAIAGRVTVEHIDERLDEFASNFENMTREQQREVFENVIDSVELYEVPELDRVVRQINFKVPVIFNGTFLPADETNEYSARDARMMEALRFVSGNENIEVHLAKNSRVDESHVETIVSLTRESGRRDFLHVPVGISDLNMEPLKGKGTYQQIKEWVKENYGLNVSTLYIAQVKDECGIEKQVKRSGGKPQPQCPPEKKEAIKAAFAHFGMINQELLKDTK